MRGKQLENELTPVVGILGPIILSEFAEYLDSAELEKKKAPIGLGGTPVNLLARRLLDLGYQLVIFTLDKDVGEELILDGPRLRICVGPYRKRAKHRALDLFAKERKYLYVNTMFYSRCSELVSKIRKRIDRYTGRYGKRREMVMSKRDSLIGHSVMSVFEKLS